MILLNGKLIILVQLYRDKDKQLLQVAGANTLSYSKNYRCITGRTFSSVGRALG